MLTLLFEVQPRAGHEDHYFEHATRLRPLVMEQAGLLFLDRFKSNQRDGLILSHSRWRDEAAITSWRTHCTHYQSQIAGRHKHFQDYRIRIARAIMSVNEQGAISDHGASNDYWEDGAKDPRYHAIAITRDKSFDETGELFESVYNEGRFLNIMECDTLAKGQQLIERAGAAPQIEAAFLCFTSRDYGMFEREEAPQYMNDVAF